MAEDGKRPRSPGAGGARIDRPPVSGRTGEARSPAIEVSPVTGEPAERAALASFLASFEGETEPAVFWERRMRLWWEENPFFVGAGAPRGWVLTSDGRIVGFLGAVPMDYRLDGKTFKALGATTWRVDRSFRKHSMLLAYAYLEWRETHLLFNTTANEVSAKVFTALGFRSIRKLRCAVFPVAQPARVPLGLIAACAALPFRALYPKGDCRLIEAAADLRSLRLPADPPPGLLHRVRSVEFFEWYCFNPLFPKDLVVSVDPEGSVNGYLVLRRVRKRGLDLLSADDFFLRGGDRRIAHSMVRHVIERHGRERTSASLGLLFFRFVENAERATAPIGPVEIDWEKPHLYALPPAVPPGTPLLGTLAEGDYGC